MSIKVVSTSEPTPEVTAPVTESTKVDAKETKSVVAQDAIETGEESDTSDDTEVEKNEVANEGDEETEGDEEDSKSKDEERPKKRNGFKKRIDKLTTRLSDKEREVEYWREQALKGSKEEPKSKVETQPQANSEKSGKPHQDHFDTHDEYIEALTEWKLEQRLEAERSREREAKLKTEFQSRVQSHVERVQEFKKTHDDFEDVIEDVDDIPISPTVQEVILASENGPRLMYELAKNREEYKRICSLGAVAAARELGKFEAKLDVTSSKKEEREETKTTKAPAPLKPVGATGSGTTRKSIFDPNLSQTEYERLRRDQMRRKA